MQTATKIVLDDVFPPEDKKIPAVSDRENKETPEALGEANPAVDAEIISLAVQFLQDLGLKDIKLLLNSVGCPKCRPVYRQKLQEFFRPVIGEMCEDCQSRYDRNPMRLLDCKNEKCKKLAENAPAITDCLCDECNEHFHKVQDFLTAAGIEFELDPSLVRGLDYYTKTAFELKYIPLGAQSAVLGGGRYDGLIEECGGKPTPAVGFATGLERVLLALEMQNLLPETVYDTDVFIVALGDGVQAKAFEILTTLRKAGFKAAMDYAGRSMKAQMKQANKANAKIAVILGENELQSNSAVVKDMADSTQETVSLEALLDTLKEKCSK